MFDYVKYRYVCAIFFLVLLGAGIGGYFYNVNKYGSAFNYSVDFTGGTQVLLKLGKTAKSGDIRDALHKSDYSGIEMREFGADEYLVRVQKFDSDTKGVGEKIRDILKKSLKDDKIEIKQTNSVGSAVGESLRGNSMKAVLLALLLMLLYVAVRFKFAFSVGAVFALFHDALVVAVFFLLTRREVSVDVIGAVLMTLGYSVNDTIVIFSRIRDNLKRMGGHSLKEVVNTSIQQTMSRTLLTSLSTGLVVGSLLVFGGELLRDLSITLLLGIVFGTYSSIFVASPVMMTLYKGKK